MKPMKNKLTQNLGLKLISVLIASIIWLVVSNNNDPDAQLFLGQRYFEGLIVP